MNTVGEFVRYEKGVNNIELVDVYGNIISNTYEQGMAFDRYLDRSVSSCTIQDRGNYGRVATLVV